MYGDWLGTAPVLSQFDQMLPIGPALELSTLGSSSTHNNTAGFTYEQLGPAHTKAGPGWKDQNSNIIVLFNL